MMDEASVVAQHLVKKMAEPMRHQKVGRRYFNNCALEGKAQLTIISGFYVALNSLNKAGPMMQIDVMHRALHKRSIIESLQSSLECDPLAAHDPDVVSEWQRRCVSATVVTLYNNRVYRVKAVHFDKSPSDQFIMYQRDEKKSTPITFESYYQAFYDRQVSEKKSRCSSCLSFVPSQASATRCGRTRTS